MASAAFESIRERRSAIATVQRRSALRGVTGATGTPCARRRTERGRWAPRTQLRAYLRGIGASVLIASGYVAAVTALRALLAAT